MNTRRLNRSNDKEEASAPSDEQRRSRVVEERCVEGSVVGWEPSVEDVLHVGVPELSTEQVHQRIRAAQELREQNLISIRGLWRLIIQT